MTEKSALLEKQADMIQSGKCVDLEFDFCLAILQVRVRRISCILFSRKLKVCEEKSRISSRSWTRFATEAVLSISSSWSLTGSDTNIILVRILICCTQSGKDGAN